MSDSLVDDPALREGRALRLSAGAALLLAIVGVLWGFAISSQVILFDGLYSLIGFVLSWLALRAAALVKRGATPKYPFGREALAPLMVAIQALVLIGTFGYAAADAVSVILAGGSQTEIGPALVYSVLVLVACVAIHQALRRMQEGSDLVEAEVVQWAASVVLGVALTIGFGVAVALQRSSWSGLAPFVDPVLVLVAAALILPSPIQLLRQAFRELLEGVPTREITDPIYAAIEEVRVPLGLPEPTTRIGKLGRKVYLELDFLVTPDGGWRVDDADRVRRELMRALAQPGRLLWINVELHTDPAWDSLETS